MAFITYENNRYSGYTLSIYVTNDLETLKSPSAKDCYKIVFIESGTIHIQLNGRNFILTGANVLCLNEKDELVIYELSENIVTILFFTPSVINNKFELDAFQCTDPLSISEQQDLFYLSQFKHNSKLTSKILQLHVIDSSVIKHKLQQLKEQLAVQGRLWPCRSRAYLFEILFSLIRPEENEDTIISNRIESSFSKLTVEVIYYLQTCYHQKITIETLAQVFHTNRTTLLADFKKSTGQSINRYLTQLRMTMAASLLRDTGLTVYEICERTGFSDISYFSKSFKKEIQFTPSEYRRINVS